MSNLEHWSALHLPDDLYPLTHEGGMVCLNISTNTYQYLKPTASKLLLALNEVGTPEPLTSFCRRQYPNLKGYESTFAVEWLEKAAKKGLVLPGQALAPKDIPHARTFTEDEINGAGEIVLSLQDVDQLLLSPHEERHADQALEQAVKLARRPFAEIARVITAQNAQISTLATPEEATRILGSINHIPPSYALGRVACLEQSIATVLCGAAQQKRIEMAVGVKLDPIAGHAWPVASDEVIRLDTDPQVVGLHHELMRMG